MSLAQRLLLALGVLTAAATLALGLGVREAWRRAEEERFREQFLSALSSLERELSLELARLPRVVEPLCKHDPIVDSALVGQLTGDLEMRRLSISLRVPELGRALGLDELTLVTSSGEVLGAMRPALAGTRDPELARALPALRGKGQPGGGSGLRVLETSCIREEPRRPRRWVGLYAARHLDALLANAAAGHGVTLSLGDTAPSADVLVRSFALDALGGLRVTATQSRTPLLRALRSLDWTILVLGGGIMLVALVAALGVSRGLARPIVRLSEQARAVSVGDPQPVDATGGGREIQEFARAFNRALSDLAELRKRLAATERIAAQREVARRVAHEIKNPLAPIRAAVETLRRLKARGDRAFEDYFDEATRTVLSEVDRINTIVTEFTRFARLPAPSPRSFELMEVARNVAQLHSTGGPEVEVRGPASVELRADRDQVVQVLTNLLQNAIEAVRGGADPAIVVEVETPNGEAVVLRVRDNGSGVEAALRDRLFEPYQTTKPEGTGLGLAIVERIVVEHGGTIDYRDAPGGGAEFVIELPRRGPPPAVEPDSPPSSVS